ncbi:MAG: hypothetical protein C5B50_06100 [Verrucomicrobia bacterium]|nr:MAG: hypothetical protein C5B50_06100 [Verrucomicrobiota bacterium]
MNVTSARRRRKPSEAVHPTNQAWERQEFHEFARIRVNWCNSCLSIFNSQSSLIPFFLLLVVSFLSLPSRSLAQGPPIITSQPQSQSVTESFNATFTVAVSSTYTPTYQWRFNGANISGATSTSYTIVNSQFSNAGSYSVAVTNSSGFAISSNAVLTVVCPTISLAPAILPGAAMGYPYLQTLTATGGNAIYNFSVSSGSLPSGLSLINGTMLSTLAGLAGYSGTNDGTGSSARFLLPGGVGVDVTGNVYVADTANSTIRKITPAGAVTTLAGLPGSIGSADGTGSNARFNHPYGVAVDAAGSLYVADTYNSTVRKVTPAGVVTTLAGLAGSTGSTDATGSNARFNFPWGIAVDSSGTLYVADTSNNTIRKVTTGGVVTTLAGQAGSSGSSDGTGGGARFATPSSVAVDSLGNVYVADTGNSTIRKSTPAGVVTTFAGLAGAFGTADGTGSNARFDEPYGVAVDLVGNVYVADSLNDTVRKITASAVVTTIAGLPLNPGSTDGPGSNARFYFPFGLVADGAGSVFVVDQNMGNIRKIVQTGLLSGKPLSLGTNAFTIMATDTNGCVGTKSYTLQVSTCPAIGISPAILSNAFAGVPYSQILTATNGLTPYAFNLTSGALPAGIALTNTATVSTFAGATGQAGSGDGIGTNTLFKGPTGVAVDTLGNLYIADNGNSTIRKITPSGVASTLAGLAGNVGSSDGGGSVARFNQPFSVAVDVSGNVYVADTFNDTIRKITPAGVVSTLAGQAGHSGSADGTSNARFFSPSAVAVDTAGNVYVADYGNDTIRKITPGGSVSTLAGLALTPGSADGTGSNARFNNPAGVAVDTAGNVYVSDYGNFTIRKITSGGVVTTLAGQVGSSGTADGTNSTARFTHAEGVVLDPAGNLYIADTDNASIRKLTPAGVVTTLLGSGGNAGSADGIGNGARFNLPTDVALDGSGNLYVADDANQLIRKAVPIGLLSGTPAVPATNNFIVTATDTNGCSASSSYTLISFRAAPSITGQPQSWVVPPGVDVSFSVVATGTLPLNYQWFRNGGPIMSATTTSFSVANVQSTNSGTYSVTAINAYGTANSYGATLAVAPCGSNGDQPPHGQQAVDPAFVSGYTGVLQDSNCGAPSQPGEPSHCGYGPYKSIYYAFVPLQTGFVTIQMVQQNFIAVLEVYTGSAASWSDLVPVACVAGAGGATMQFCVTAGVTNWVNVSSAISNTCGTYQLYYTNTAAPTIFSQPVGLPILAGGSANLSTTAGGSPPLTFQWRANGSNIPGASGTTNLGVGITSFGTTLTNQIAGNYTLVVTNAYGSVTSQVATVTLVLANPTNAGSITLNSANQTITATANTNAGWNFGAWSDSVTNSTRSYASLGLLTNLTANFIPVTFKLTSPAFVSPTSFSMTVNNSVTNAGHIVVEASTNFQTWVPLYTNPIITTFIYTDTQVAGRTNRYYRASLTP